MDLALSKKTLLSEKRDYIYLTASNYDYLKV